MTLQLPRLPPTEPQWSQFQLWWQQVAEAIEAANTSLEDTIDDLTDVLVRLGLVEVLADDTLAIVDQGLNPDGTVKPNKVATTAVQASAISGPTVDSGSTTAIPDTGVDTTIMTSSTVTVGDATFGSAVVFIQGVWTNGPDPDAGAELHLETSSNGGAWVRQRTIRVGARTGGGGSTTAYIPVHHGFSISGVGLLTVQSRIIGTAVDIGAGLHASSFRDPAVITWLGKR